MASQPRGLRVKPMGNSLALHSCAEAAKHKHMVQRVGYFIVFLTACRLLVHFRPESAIHDRGLE